MSFPIEQQLETNWCWAAVSSSADHYFDRASTLTQCKIAGQIMGGDCCTNRDVCDQAMALQNVLGPLGRLDGTIASPVDFARIRNEIKAHRPVAVRIAWFGGGAHFVLICGYSVMRSGLRRIEIADPFYGDVDNGQYFGIWEIDFDLFPAAYQAGGDWTATFLLRMKPGENP